MSLHCKNTQDRPWPLRRGLPPLWAVVLLASSAGAIQSDAVGGVLAAYLTAREEGRGVAAARGAVATAFEPREGAPQLLADPAGLARAFRLARANGAAHSVESGKVLEDVFQNGSFEGAGLAFAYRLPADYDPQSGDGYPLIVTVPDQDQRPAEHLRADWTHRPLLEAAILIAPSMPPERARWERVLASGKPGGLSHVFTVRRLATERFAVDPDRVYVVGRGKGVPVAVAAGNAAPQHFAGVVGRAGDAADQGPENFGNLPVLFTGGGGHARAFQEAALAAGHEDCTLSPAGKEADVWEWMQRHPRRTYPRAVSVVPGDPFPTRAYWLRMAPSAADARASASVERETNTIRIESSGVSHVTLYLNDALLDLERPVSVVWEGSERTYAVPRDLAAMLDLFHEGTSDAGCVYVAEVVVAADADSVSALAESETDAAFDTALLEGKDASSLWALYQAAQDKPYARRALAKLLRFDPEHAEARAALGHVRHSAGWFPSAAALERFTRDQDPVACEALGRVEHQGIWVHADERALLRKGATKDPGSGVWTTREDGKRLDAGWLRQDLEWIAPPDVPSLDRGLWQVDGEWMSLARADRRHARPDAMWVVPGPVVVVHSSADRGVALRAMQAMEAALPALQRVFGAEPVLPLRACVLRDEEQYDRFAFGAPDGRRSPTHTQRLHALHSAFLAESWFEREAGELTFRGMGVCYWDPWVPYGDRYGVHSARLAFGLSYVDALDPSPKAVRKALKDGPGREHAAAYTAEKGLPPWLRYGGAVYAERYYYDDQAAQDADPWWPRAWSLDNLEAAGGMRPLDEVLAFALDPDQREDGRKLLLEAGLLVAFVVDGGCAPVAEAHAELKRSLASSRLHPKRIQALEEALRAHEAELLAFATGE